MKDTTVKKVHWRDKEPDIHEKAHEAKCKKLGIPYRWVNRRGEPVIEAYPGTGKLGDRRAAIALAAGAVAGGGDSDGDWKVALRLAKGIGMSEAELRREAKR